MDNYVGKTLEVNKDISLKLLQISDLKVGDIAIGTCWDKQRDDDVVDTDRMYKVANKFKHSSTIEHMVITLYIKGVSRALLQEAARHRIASLSVKSTRYTLKELKEEKPFVKFLPIEPCEDGEITCGIFHDEGYEISDEAKERAKQYVHLKDIEVLDNRIILALENLRQLIASGMSNDKAKYALPDAYKTELTWTINFRSLQNFIKLRTDKAALQEIRDLANGVYEILPEEYKFLFKDFVYQEK